MERNRHPTYSTLINHFFTKNKLEKSHGFLSLTPLDQNGKEIMDIERQCTLRGTEQGWFLDNADISEWYAYAIYLRDKVILGDSYPVPAGKDVRSNAPYFIWGAVVLIVLIGIIFSLKSMRKKKN